jgi:hypothetical protein
MNMNWKTALALGAVIVVALLLTDAIQTYKAKQKMKQAAAAAAGAAVGAAVAGDAQ